MRHFGLKMSSAEWRSSCFISLSSELEKTNVLSGKTSEQPQHVMRTFGPEDELEPDLIPLVQLSGAAKGAWIWYRVQQNLGPVQETTDTTIRGMTRETGKTRLRTGTAEDGRDARPGQNLFFF